MSKAASSSTPIPSSNAVTAYDVSSYDPYETVISLDKSLDSKRYLTIFNGKVILAPMEPKQWIRNGWNFIQNPLWRAPRFREQDNVWIPDDKFVQEPREIGVNGRLVPNKMFREQQVQIKDGKLVPYTANRDGGFVPKSSNANNIGAFVPKSSSQEEFALSSGGSNKARSFLRKRKQGVSRTSLNTLRRSLRRKRIPYVQRF